MLTVFSVVLYGGALYYVAIAMKWDLAKWFYRFRLGFVVTWWQKGPEGRVVVVVGFIAILLVIEAAIVGFGGGPPGPEPPPEGEWVARSGTVRLDGVTTEGMTDEAFPEVDDMNVVAADITFGWSDIDANEPGPGITPLAPKNQPDTFRVTVTLADGTTYSEEGTNDPDTRLGEIDLTVPIRQEGNLSGWIIEVECVQAGDVVGQFGRVWTVDDGNQWDMLIDYTYLEWVVPEE